MEPDWARMELPVDLAATLTEIDALVAQVRGAPGQAMMRSGCAAS